MKMVVDNVKAPPADRDAAERDLLRRIALSERAALETLYRAYQGRLARFLHGVTRYDALIDEVVNETFWIVWQKADTFRGDSQVSTWILGIAYRCALKALQRDDNGAGQDAMDEDCVDPAAQHADMLELRDWISCGLRTLNIEQRVVIELAYYHGYSCEEIADIMDSSTSTIKARLFHARVKLRNRMPALVDNARREQP
jgi:RNA polymerase sigma-70 factor (ECF subfamily)